ncbi:response regulator transcription factor [Phycicoccus sp. Soil748]|uniref:response regulator transcription factor n=1 Tax=Intrasporangiaceae TaxID=85021 RepID=UPI000702BB80|nr:response regulator transcription factor [Phycicoccus sp. Soil748]KRE56489.1 LuxR family transcriptional regulator [Phycicoccus sp. Soil748]
MIRLVVVDDQELVRDGFALILDAQDDIEVVGTAADGASAVALCRAEQPDVALMDLRMPVLDGIEATRRVVVQCPGVRVLVLTTFDDDENVVRALRAGASGFLLKDTPRAALVASVRAVAEGETMLDAAVLRRLVSGHLRAPGPAHAAALARLTGRESEVMRCVAQGQTNAEIAAALHISETTVKTHVARLLAKWGARDRVALVVLAHEAGLVP